MPDLATHAMDVSGIQNLARKFLEYLQTYRRASPHTVSAYRGDLARLERFLAERRLPLDPGALTSRHIQAFAISLSGLAPASVNRALNACSSFFGWLGRQGLVEGNPVADVERPKVPLKLPNGPSLGDAQQLVEAARNPREQSMVLLLACCGLRRSELLNLDTGDLSGDLSELRVRQGKGQKDRLVPIPEQCQAVLREYLIAHGGRIGPLFATGKGTRLGATGFYSLFRRLLRRAGLDDAGITPHGLRHLYATSLLRGRADVETVRSLLGHRDLRTTSRYLHASDDGRRAAVEALPLFVAPASDPDAVHGEGRGQDA